MQALAPLASHPRQPLNISRLTVMFLNLDIGQERTGIENAALLRGRLFEKHLGIVPHILMIGVFTISKTGVSNIASVHRRPACCSTSTSFRPLVMNTTWNSRLLLPHETGLRWYTYHDIAQKRITHLQCKPSRKSSRPFRRLLCRCMAAAAWKKRSKGWWKNSGCKVLFL